jgi:hypothetical protein
MSGEWRHRWDAVARVEDRLVWRCTKCAIEVTTSTHAITPRSGHDDVRDADGVFIDRMPQCGHAERPRYPRRHVWHVTARHDRAHWSCKRCGVEAETPISVTHPSASSKAMIYARRRGDAWSRLSGALGPCEAQP